MKAIKKFVPDADVDKAYLKNTLELYYGVTFKDIKDAEIDRNLLGVFNVDDFDKYKFLPIKQNRNIFNYSNV